MDELTKRVYDFAKERLDGLTRGDGKTPVFEGHACIVAEAVRRYFGEELRNTKPLPWPWNFIT